ncbi:MAG: asparagine synthase (glutamine-hydrolyzing), partial [Proteobacteria bacterium]|nr:asparagine synthase (glutamine-hydrolyzing) [Pseudomonadota bacterium]
MVGALAHRGPDGDGTFIDRDQKIALGHRRLAIIDLSNAAAQPMASADNRYQITYNGEIYNYRRLRAELESRGVRFRTQSDTEVLLELFIREGVNCVLRLEGIFAFAVWDKVERRLFIARDQIGVKPLYYASLPNGFLFASEIKALLLCPDVSREIDAEGVAAHLSFLWTADEHTMLKSVKKLRPGHYATIDERGVRISNYFEPRSWDPAGRQNKSSPGEFLELFDKIVADQMVADVDVGALLSGGVDSSAIVASMVRATDPSKIKTFCATVSNGGNGLDNLGDDIFHARAVAQRLDVELIEVPTDTEMIDDLPDMLWSLDEPTADFAALQAYKVAETARANGLKVLMSGVGGDDLLTGYPRHRLALFRQRFGWLPGMRHLFALGGHFFKPETMRGRRLRRAGQLLGLPESDMIVEAMSFSALLRKDCAALLSPDIRMALGTEERLSGLEALAADSHGQDAVVRQLHLELNSFVPDHNLNYVDKMSMRAGVEVRVPYLDPRLVTYAARLPLGQKINARETKRILRQSQRDRLPPEILTRGKQGFGVPIRSWLSQTAKPLLEELTSRDVIT